MFSVIEKALKNSENASVPTNKWVEVRILAAKTYLIRNQVYEAISTLRDVCFLLPPFPVDSLEFINDPDIEGDL